MAGGDASADAAKTAKLSGLSKIFNGETMRGRANVALATYCSIGALIVFFTLKPKKKPQPAK